MGCDLLVKGQVLCRANEMRPALRSKEAERLLGEKVNNIAVYDLSNMKLLKDTYNEHRIICGCAVRELATNFKDACSQSVTFKDKEPVLVVAKTISYKFDDRRQFFMPVPEYSKIGTVIVSNVILYDIAQKRYAMLYNTGAWRRVGRKTCYLAAAEEVIYATLQDLVRAYKIK
jgi:hypothetical protein